LEFCIVYFEDMTFLFLFEDYDKFLNLSLSKSLFNKVNVSNFNVSLSDDKFFKGDKN